MKTEEYLQILSDQIRCVKAREPVIKEIRDHLEEQKEGYMEEGMEEKEAERLAVETMGDPVEVGISMDAIHRPRVSRKLIVSIAAVSLAGFLLQFLLQSRFPQQDILPGNVFVRFLYLLAGFGVMMGVCYLDYSRIGYYGKEIYFALLGIMVLAILRNTRYRVNGSLSWMLIFNGMGVNLRMILFLFAPIYGAVIYRLRGKGYGSLAAGTLYMLPPMVLAFLMSDVITMLTLFAIFVIILIAAVAKGWFRVAKKRAIGGILAISAAFPLLMGMFYYYCGAEYQRERIKGILGMGNAEEYFIYAVRQAVEKSRLFGRSSAVSLPEGGDYVLTYALTCYGIIVTILIAGAILLLSLQLLRISWSQKNQLGLLMGVGCAGAFLVLTILYVLGNFGFFPAERYCPFITYGGTGIFVTYIMLGILLSVYRHDNVLPVCPGVRRRMRETSSR